MTNFFIVSAGASATLVGLLFVAVQFGPPLSSAGGLGRRHAMARSTFTIFAIVFAVSLYELMPGQTGQSRALVVLGAAAAGAFRAARTWLPVWRDKLQGRIEFRLWQTAWLLLGPLIAYAYWAYWAFAALRSNSGVNLRLITGGVFVILFVIGLRNSWNLLVEAMPAAASS